MFTPLERFEQRIEFFQPHCVADCYASAERTRRTNRHATAPSLLPLRMAVLCRAGTTLPAVGVRRQLLPPDRQVCAGTLAESERTGVQLQVCKSIGVSRARLQLYRGVWHLLASPAIHPRSAVGRRPAPSVFTPARKCPLHRVSTASCSLTTVI